MSDNRRPDDRRRRRGPSPVFLRDSNTSQCDSIEQRFKRRRRNDSPCFNSRISDDDSINRRYAGRSSPFDDIHWRDNGSPDSMRNEDEMALLHYSVAEDLRPKQAAKWRRLNHYRKELSPISSHEAISEIVKRLIRFQGRCTISMKDLRLTVYSDHLGEDIERISEDRTLEGFLGMHKDVFSLEDTTVIYKFTLQICKEHSTNPGSCDGYCNDLHLCKFHLMSNCTASLCKYGHGEDSEHNDRVRWYHFLDRLVIKELCVQLLSLDNRRGLTVPDVCTYYNAKGCNKGNKCPFLHICQHYIMGDCKFPQCKRSHSMSDRHTGSILESFGLARHHPEEITQLLRMEVSEQNLNRRRLSFSPPPRHEASNQQWVMRIDGQRDLMLRSSETKSMEQMYKDCLAVVRRTRTGKMEHSFDFTETTVCLKGGDLDVEFKRMPVNIVSRR